MLDVRELRKGLATRGIHTSRSEAKTLVRVGGHVLKKKRSAPVCVSIC